MKTNTILSILILTLVFIISIGIVNAYNGDYCNRTNTPCSLTGDGITICTSTDLSNMYNGYNFTSDVNDVGDITGWNTSCIIQMNNMFEHSNFNQPIGNWDTSNVIYFDAMFIYNHDFNQQIRWWNTSNAESMSGMFREAISFNDELNWNTSKVMYMNDMFLDATNFNGNVVMFDTSNVRDMQDMFRGATSFNQPIQNIWNTSKVENFNGMFSGATSFDQDLSQSSGLPSAFTIESAVDMSNMFTNVTLSTSNYDNMLNAFYNQPHNAEINFDGGNSLYSINGSQSRAYLQTNYGNNIWTISDGGLDSGICNEDWIRVSEPCINDNILIWYVDLNNCGTINNIPNDFGTNEACNLANITIINPTNNSNMTTSLTYFESLMQSRIYNTLQCITYYDCGGGISTCSVDNYNNNTLMNSTFPCDISICSYGNVSLRIACDDGVNVIAESNITINYIEQGCIENWLSVPQPCINNFVQQIYSDSNNCNTTINIPSNNGTYTNCTIAPSILAIDSKSIIFSFTELDFIFWVIIIVISMLPFIMKDKRYLSLYVLSGMIIGVYSFFIKLKLDRVNTDNTLFVYFIFIVMLLIAFSVLVVGIMNGLKTLNNEHKNSR